MSPTKPTTRTAPAIRPLHTSTAAVEYDIANLAWVEFDQHIDAGIARHEILLEKYLTRQAVRTTLGR